MWSHQEEVSSQGFSIIYNGTLSVRLIVTTFGLVLFEQLIGATAILFYMEKVVSLTRKFFYCYFLIVAFIKI